MCLCSNLFFNKWKFHLLVCYDQFIELVKLQEISERGIFCINFGLQYLKTSTFYLFPGFFTTFSLHHSI